MSKNQFFGLLARAAGRLGLAGIYQPVRAGMVLGNQEIRATVQKNFSSERT